MISHKERCDICQGTRHEIKYRINEHKIIRCKDCTFMWLTPVPTVEELHEVYNEDYFQNSDFFSDDPAAVYGYTSYLEERFTRQANYTKTSRSIIEALGTFRPGDTTLLDVGCGYGFYLDVAQDDGFVVEGIEFNGAVVEQARKKYSFPIEEGDVMEIQGRSFDVITMFDVIEHVPDLVASVKKCYELLNPGGLFVFSTMDSDGFVSRLFGDRIEDFRRVREHLYFPTRRSMTRLLEDVGYKLLGINSYGHTFQFDDLARRVKEINRGLGAGLGFVVDVLRIGKLTVDVDPHTKMIVYARKR